MNQHVHVISRPRRYSDRSSVNEDEFKHLCNKKYLIHRDLFSSRLLPEITLVERIAPHAAYSSEK